MARKSFNFPLLCTFLLAAGFVFNATAWGASSQLVLVENGKALAPIVVPDGATPMTLQAADELATYIEKTSGARPGVLHGLPSPVPEHAIWVGYQPELKTLFPKQDFDFKFPEEILIAANADHLVIVGRDRWDPDHPTGKIRGGGLLEGVQQEYGTANAVYTFLQDKLGVRWFWAGPGGESVLNTQTIAFEPFAYRYHPQFRQRSTLLRFSARNWNKNPRSGDWTRRQRLQLDSLDAPAGGGAFGTWWERFHTTHPEYFALQPDGTRSGYPEPGNTKICLSNPAVWQQWLEDVASQLENDPHQTVFNAAENDSSLSGYCVCENCLAWDNPDAPKVQFRWQGIGQLGPALADRQITFANHLGQLLKEKYPDKDYYVCIMAYGNSRPAPVAARPASNVLVSGVFNFVLRDNVMHQLHMPLMRDWNRLVPQILWRPNLGNGTVGWMRGLPDIATKETIEDFQFAANHGAIGVFMDSVWEHWATQGPVYYIMAHMLWNPYQDGQAVMEDYYHRAFGPACQEMKTYWARLEQMRDKVASHPDILFDRDIQELYTPQMLDELKELLDHAAAKVAQEPQEFQDRVAFVRVGYDYTSTIVKIRTLMISYEASKLTDQTIAAQIDALWHTLRTETAKAHPDAMNWRRLAGKKTQGLMVDQPNTKRLTKRAISKRNKSTAPANADAPTTSTPTKAREVSTSASEAGWALVWQDDFGRAQLGKDWQIVSGDWEVEEGQLVGSGTLISALAFPEGENEGYQRLEFDATAIGKSVDLGTANLKPVICDVSSILHAKPKSDKHENIKQTGYFFQFGGHDNTLNGLRRIGQTLAYDTTPAVLITPGKTQHIIVENDQGQLRLIVDGKLVLDVTDKTPVLGDGHNRVGFYAETTMKVDNVKVYVKQVDDGLE